MLLPIAVRASRRLRSQNEQLGEQARHLEALLAREQQTVAELRHLNQMKNDFAQVASHELRSPLTAIIGYAKTMGRPEFESDPKARHEFLAGMERQGARLLRMVNNLLRASEVEHIADTEEVEAFDLRELVEEVREGWHEAGSRIRVAVPGDLPPVGLDRTRIGEILANLVDNALKYSPEGSPVVVGASIEDGELRMWVRDDGIGIAEMDRGRVFERFYQVDQSATRRYGGVGLGLYLLRELAQAAGGRVEVESELGVGSTFTVTLPLRHADGARRGNGSKPATVGTVPAGEVG